MPLRRLTATTALFRVRPLVAACLLAASCSASAATYIVSSEAELAAAITAVNSSSSANFIEYAADITLTGALPPITGTVTIKGNSHTLTGDGSDSLLTIGTDSGRRILVQISDLGLKNGVAQGSTGSDGAGGGLGAGAAILVNSHADVVLNSVQLTGNTAVGGQGAPVVTTAPGGSGGYGDGGPAGGSAGTGGGSGGSTGGGGGAALGGAVFVAEGAGLTVSGNTAVSGNAVVAGSGAGDGGNGLGAGSGLFLQGSGNLNLRLSGAQSMTIADNIADAAGSGLPGASPDDKWNIFITGGGGIPVDTSHPELGNVYARVTLSGANSFGGDLYVSGADLAVTQTASLGSASSVLALDDGGIYLAGGMTLAHDVVVNSGGARLGVDAGTATFSGNLDGAGTVAKGGRGNLVLAGTATFSGNWVVRQGNLVLDGDARLGSGGLVLDGGGIVYGAAFNDLRAFSVTTLGGSIDNGGFNVTLGNAVSGWDAGSTLTFQGGGTTTLTGSNTGVGNTAVVAGRVVGNIAQGALSLAPGATYDLGGGDHRISALGGAGDVVLGSNDLTIALAPPSPVQTVPDTLFQGTISGSGGLTVTSSGMPAGFSALDATTYLQQSLLGTNTYSGGTVVGPAVLLTIGSDASLGSGGVTLQGGLIASQQSSSNLDLVLDGGGGLAGDLAFNGVISGTGTFMKLGSGTLTLNNANTYVGDTIVAGSGSYLALANANALGLGNLELTQGGGLKVLTDTTNLRPIEILDGVGVVDTGSFDVQSTGGITGTAATSSLQKQGSGRLLLNGDLNLPGGIDIAGGILQVGSGGSAGSITGNVAIESGAQLVVDRSGTLTLAGDITGNGSMLVNGSGTVTLAPADANTFLGGLTVTNGTVAAASEQALGFGTLALDDNGGLQLLGDINRDATVGSGGARLVVDAGGSFTYAGNLSGSGFLAKTGDGTLVATGVLGQTGGTEVQAGTLQIGTGLSGTLTGDVTVDAGATLTFGRADTTQYDGVISGAGNVVKDGSGQLILTGEQLFAGTFMVDGGSLRIGFGGTQGSLSGDVQLATDTSLIFDRGDDSTFNGSTAGSGTVVKNGGGVLTVLGNLDHSGGTRIVSGVLQVGNGGTTGSIQGDVSTGLGTRLAINRSDDIVLAANLSGDGSLVQAGSGTTTLTGTNTQTGGVLVSGGTLAVDSDARLGGGDLSLDGGTLRYLAAFNDLRDIRLGAGGGGLDTNGFDVSYGGLISGSGPFVKRGTGRLVFTGTLVSSLMDVEAGELQLGDNSPMGSLAGNIYIASGATVSLDIINDVNFIGTLAGTGTFRQKNVGELHMQGDFSGFAGETVIERGSLNLQGQLGGDVQLLTDTLMTGTGSVLGSLSVGDGARVTPGNFVTGTLNVGGNLTLAPTATLEMNVNADGSSDRINVTGTANLDGMLHVVPQAGDYTQHPSYSYTLLTAGAVAGTFSAVNNDLVFLNSTVSYTPTEVDVTFTRNSTAFTTVSLTYNQGQVAAALDAMQAVDPGNPLALAVSTLSADQARDAYDSLSGDSLLNAVDAAGHAARRFAGMLSARGSRLGLASRGGGAPLSLQSDLAALQQGRQPALPDGDGQRPGLFAYDGPTARVEGVWVEAQQVSLAESADKNVGSAGSTLSGQLLGLGSDGYWSDNLILGFGAGYLQGDLGFDNRSSKGSTTAEFVGAYGRYETDAGLQYKAVLTLGREDTDQMRTVNVAGVGGSAASSASVTTATSELEAGLALHVGSFGLRPYATTTVQYLDRAGFGESGAGAADLQVGAGNDVLGEFGVGMELSRPWLTDGARWAQIRTGLALLQPFGATQREQTLHFSGQSEAFTVRATADDSAALALTLGGEWYLTPGLALWAGYEGRISSSTQEHNGVISIQYRW